VSGGGSRRAAIAHNRRVGRRGRDTKRHRWAPDTSEGIKFKSYGENERGVGGYSNGGYTVFWNGEEIGKIARHYPTWERKPKGLRYVTARGVSSTPVWRIPTGECHEPEFRSRAEAAEKLLALWKEKHS
jgi:hypothetical protein